MIPKERQFYVAIFRSKAVVYSETQDKLIEYIHMLKPKYDIDIYRMTTAQIRKMQEMDDEIWNVEPIDDVVTNYKDEQIFLTSSDTEYIYNAVEEDCEYLVTELKRLLQILKMYNTKDGKNLKKAIKRFLRDPINDNNLALDNYDSVQLLMDKIDIVDYAKKTLRGLHGISEAELSEMNQ